MTYRKDGCNLEIQKVGTIGRYLSPHGDDDRICKILTRETDVPGQVQFYRVAFLSSGRYARMETIEYSEWTQGTGIIQVSQFAALEECNCPSSQNGLHHFVNCKSLTRQVNYLSRF